MGSFSCRYWVSVIVVVNPPPLPFNIEILRRVEPPWRALREWIPDDEPVLNRFNQERDPTGADPECFDQSPDWKPQEIPLGDGHTLIPEDS
jgi:hypothetical protein